MNQGRKMFFSEEKNQKTFESPRSPRAKIWPESEASAETKVFWFFFSKKNIPYFSMGH
jgi:ribosomal protein L24E